MKERTKKKDKLFLMLLAISDNLKDGGKHFLNYKIKEERHLDEFRLKMKEYEHKGDDLVDELIKDLNNTFITPIEDIIDGLEECAAHFYMYNIYEIDDYMVQFSDLLNNCIIEINNAVELLSNKKLTDMRQHTVKIKEYEEKCDELERTAIKVLFEREKDFVRLIQYKEIYGFLEGVADDCKKVGKVLETVIMKNA